MIKFNKHHVTNGTEKARVYYSLDNRADGRKVVTLYAKDYGQGLGKLFVGEVKNDSDMREDYSETDRVNLFEGHPLYLEARAKIEEFKARK